MERRRLILLSFVFLIVSACGVQEMKFDKTKWNEKDDKFYAYRENMVNDLMKYYLKKGMTFREVEELLGKSENYQSDPQNTIGYEIMVDYGWNIDPQKGKILYIEFSKDSILKSVKLEKWKH
jgi:hypothetical protein